MCGGTALPAGIGDHVRGLSPRVRGNRTLDAIAQALHRSIPACAGEPPVPPPVVEAPEVYPRVCGGTRRNPAQQLVEAGLSPRVRGNRVDVGCIRQGTGSIPACAGEPPAWPSAGAICAVYPRVCGGTPGHSEPRLKRRGLSPRVRGNPSTMRSLVSSFRSIPACAGEPIVNLGPDPQIRVYPRVCGGTGNPFDAVHKYLGLSPRVRGNRLVLFCACLGLWSIPACAGEPGILPYVNAVHWVYPRVCGGTMADTTPMSGLSGLSPRVRGNRQPIRCCP